MKDKEGNLICSKCRQRFPQNKDGGDIIGVYVNHEDICGEGFSLALCSSCWVDFIWDYLDINQLHDGDVNKKDKLIISLNNL